MELEGYRRIEIFRAKMNASFQRLHCIAELDEDIGKLLPFLNTRLGGYDYTCDPPALILKFHGKLVTFHADRVAVNALVDEDETRGVLLWILREIQETRAELDELEPTTTGAPRPSVVRILSLLPRTNCGACHAPTCLVYATRLIEGVLGPEDCTPLGEPAREALTTYLRETRVRL